MKEMSIEEEATADLIQEKVKTGEDQDKKQEDMRVTAHMKGNHTITTENQGTFFLILEVIVKKGKEDIGKDLLWIMKKNFLLKLNTVKNKETFLLEKADIKKGETINCKKEE